MKSGIKKIIPRKFSQPKKVAETGAESTSSADSELDIPGGSTPKGIQTLPSASPETPVVHGVALPQPPSVMSDCSTESSAKLKSHLSNVKKSLDDVMGSRYSGKNKVERTASSSTPPADHVPLEHVRKLTDTVVDMLRDMSKSQNSSDVYLDKSILEKQAKKYVGSGSDSLSQGSGDTSSIKESEISAKTALLKAQFLPQPEYLGDDVLPFYMDNDSVLSSETGGDPDFAFIPKTLKKRVKINWPGLIVYVLYIVAFIAYITIRSIYTMDLGSSLWYGIIVLLSEVLGAFAVLPYGLCLVLKVDDPVPEAVSRASQGLPAYTALNYHIRVLIPCYKEPLDVVTRTFLASMYAALPLNCKRTVYLLDDGKDPEKKEFVRSLNMPNAVYISGRKRAKGEMNGKSCNINNAMRHIYPGDDLEIPSNEVICVFDADQVCNADFFSKTVPLLDGGEDVAMILTPQAFSNLNHDGDIFNHANVHFWDYTQPGYDALGLISCTGTNFLLRANAFKDAGWFPEWTLTEDFALGIELKRRKWQCRYVDEYLALGEAPEEIRNCFQQRSRWAKGHFQLFSNPKRNPTFGKGAEGLSLLMRWMYGSVALSYFSAFIGTPLLMLVPLVTVWFGVFPIVINLWCAIAVTIYYPCTMFVMYYTRSLRHFKSMWFAAVANSILWWAFLKALYRATIGRWFAGTIVFKVTAKGLQKLSNLPIRDVWMATVWFIFSLVSLIFGLITYIRGDVTDTPLAISIIFIAYNMIPLYLLLQYAVYRQPMVYNLVCRLMMYTSTVLSLLGVVLVWLLYPRAYNYGDALTNSLFFMDTQRLGQLPDDFRVPWRHSAYLSEARSPVYLAENINDTLPLNDFGAFGDDFGTFDSMGVFGFGRKLRQDGGAADAFAAAADSMLNADSGSDDASTAEASPGFDPFAIQDTLTENLEPVENTPFTGSSSLFDVGVGSDPLAADPFAAGGAATTDPFAVTTDPFAAGGATTADPFAATADPFAAGGAGMADPFAATADPFTAGGSSSDPFGDFGADPFGSPSTPSDPFTNPSDPFGGMGGFGGGFGDPFGGMDPFMDPAAMELKLATPEPWDLSGGWVTGMEGGNIKSTSPIAFTTAVLSWGFMGFQDAFEKVAQSKSLLESVRVGADYLLKVHRRTPSGQALLVSRVGDAEKEVEKWYRPEDGKPRDAIAVDMSSKEGGYGADLGGSVAAGLAAASSLFMDHNDTAYSNTLLSKAREVYEDSTKAKYKFNRADYNQSELYNSTCMYDDLAWAASWLYKVTKEQRYLEDVYDHYIHYLEKEGSSTAWKYAFDWDNVFWPTNILMAQETGNATFVKHSEEYLRSWMCANNAANYTKRGRAYNAFSAPLGSTANVAMTAFMYADLIEEESAAKSQAYRCWGLSQVRYMMGDAGRSMVIGQGHNPPKRTQDRGAACPAKPNVCNRVTSYLSPEPDTYTLTGALVHGAAKSDYYIDDRTNDAARVGVETNAGWVGALGGAAMLPDGMWEICLQQFGIYREDPICGSFVTL
jgi:cellulose synthase/poly-beta-1,6-N-acetylglucosamine synthase-like glycosyltransferase